MRGAFSGLMFEYAVTMFGKLDIGYFVHNMRFTILFVCDGLDRRGRAVNGILAKT